MNLVSLEVKVIQCNISVPKINKLSFSLRVGTVLSHISDPIDISSSGQTCQQTNMQLSCDEDTIVAHSRACLIIYSVEKQQKKIIGMSFILLQPSHFYEKKEFKVHQCSDKNATINVLFSVSNLEVRNENRSQTSKSSLNEIKQFHKELSRSHRKKRSSEHKQRYLSPQSIRKFPQSEGQDSKNFSLQRFQSLEKNNDIIDELESKLNQACQKITVLNNMLIIQETKYRTAEKFIRMHLRYFKKWKDEDSPDSMNNQKLLLNKSTKNLHEIQINSFNNGQENKQKEKQQNLIEFHAISKERDELFSICEELYKKIKNLKQQLQNYEIVLKEKENEIEFMQEEGEDLKRQNMDLKTKMFEFCDQDDIMKKNNMLTQECKELKIANKEFERKFKESYKAIETFKNDALEAREEIINKEEQIEKLTKELLNHQEIQMDNTVIQVENEVKQMGLFMKQNQKMKQKNLISLIKIINRKQGIEQVSEWENSKKIQEKLKQKVNQTMRDYQRRRVKTVQLIELRQNLMKIVNQI